MSAEVWILKKKSNQSIFKILYKGSTCTYFKESNIPQLPEIYKLKLCSMFGKYIKDGMSNNDYISNYLQLNSDIHIYNARIRKNFSVPYFLISASKSCFIYQSINILNSSWENWSRRIIKPISRKFEIIPCFPITNIWKHVLVIQYLFNLTVLVYWLRYWFLSMKYQKMSFTGTIFISFYDAGLMVGILVIVTTKSTKIYTKWVTLRFLI